MEANIVPLRLDGPHVLVTGAGGFLGSWVCRQLAKTTVVITAAGRRAERLGEVVQTAGAERSPHAVLHSRVMDLLDQPRIFEAVCGLSQITHVLHLACPVPRSGIDDDKFMKKADQVLIGVMQVLQKLPRLEHITFLSSASVYGAEFDSPIGEKSPRRRLPTGYAQHKQNAEERLAQWAGQRGLPLAILRMCQVYGPAEPHQRALTKMVRAAAKGRPITLDNQGTDERDFLFIGDAAGAIVQAALRQASGTFNISSGVGVPMRRWAAAIAAAAPLPIDVRYLPATRAPTSLVYENSKMKRELNCVPSVTPEKGVQACMDFELDRRTVGGGAATPQQKKAA